MARKDVELIIRARDEASRAVTSITKSLEQLTGAQADLVQASTKTDSTVGALGASLRELNRSMKGLDVASTIAKQLDSASASVERLQTEFKGLAVDATKADKAMANSAAQSDRLRAKTEGAAAAQAKSAASLKQAAQAQSLLTAQLKKANTEQTKLASAATRNEKAIAANTAKVDAARAKYAALNEQVSQAVAPTKKLTTALTASSVALQKSEARLDSSKQKFAENQKQIATTAKEVTDLTAALTKATVEQAKLTKVTAKISANYKNLGVASKSAERNYAALSTAADRASASLEKQGSSIKKAELELDQLRVTAGKADKVMSELAGTASTQLESAFSRQRRTMLETKRVWSQLTAETTKLATNIGKVGVPTREMVEDFAQLKIAAAGAKQEFITQRNALQQLNLVMRESGNSLESLANKQQRFEAIQRATAAAAERTRTATAEQSAQYAKLATQSNRAATAVSRVGVASRNAAAGMAAASASTNVFTRSVAFLGRSQRTTLSVTQRLRGEVFALIAAYGGLYGVIEVLQQTVAAFQTLEAATSRLNVSFEGDAQKVAVELDFLRRTADRLGIEFGVLANEYSKFTIATKTSNINAQETRDIFLAVSEAARVNKSSLEEMRGVFTALVQIVSKGAVQMEELRQQLGDRLPGALQIMAAGLNVTTAELIKMMEQGEVTEEALIPFAEELQKRFGPGLQDALKTTTTAIGRFKNALFQALIAFGEAGFLDSFTELLLTMTETLNSADFRAFAENVSQAFAVLTDVVTVAVDNFDTLFILLSAFAGLKLAPLVIKLAAAFRVLGVTVAGMTGSFAAFGVAATTTGAALTTGAGAAGLAAKAFGLLSVALRALLSTTGIGLAVVAVATGLGYWATRADEATEALTEHKKIVDEVKNAYEAAGSKADGLADALASGSVARAQQNLLELREAAEDARDAVRTPYSNSALFEADANRKMRELTVAFKEGTVTATELQTALEGLRNEAGFDSDLADYVLEEVAAFQELEEAVEKSLAILRIAEGTATDADKALLGLKTSTDEAATSIEELEKQTKQFDKTMIALSTVVKETGTNLQELKDKANLDGAFESAARAAVTMGQLNQAVGEYNTQLGRIDQGAVDRQFGKFTDGAEASAALLRQSEGFRATPYYDVNADRIGFGSDTVTLADGSVKKVVEGMRISVADANRDLYRRIGEFQNVVKNQVGADRFASFNAQQQAALTSIAYNYGELPGRIVGAVRSGTDQEVAKAIRGLGGDNSGVNRGRRNQEAALFTSTAGVEAQSEQFRSDREREAQAAEKQAEAIEKFRSGQAESIEQAQFELSVQDQALVKRQQMLAIREAEKEAQAAGTELSEKERQQILAVTEAKFRQKQVDEESAAIQERASEAQERVNLLLGQQAALQEQLKIYKETGDQEKVAETETALQALNIQLQEAIVNAQGMWAAVGGTAADTAITKLSTASLKAAELDRNAQKNILDWGRVGELFAGGLTNAFDKFAQAVANGEDVGEAARTAFLQFASDFLRQIAQMIIKQAILNALSAFGGGGGVGSFFGFGHTGGRVGSKRVGSGNMSRRVNPAAFVGAQRFHSGGTVGLRPGEVPIIAQEGEEVLAKNDPRNSMNGGAEAPAAASTSQGVTVINAIDSGSFISEGLGTSVGEKAIMNFMRANSGTIKSALG